MPWHLGFQEDKFPPVPVTALITERAWRSLRELTTSSLRPSGNQKKGCLESLCPEKLDFLGACLITATGNRDKCVQCPRALNICPGNGVPAGDVNIHLALRHALRADLQVTVQLVQSLLKTCLAQTWMDAIVLMGSVQR